MYYYNNNYYYYYYYYSEPYCYYYSCYYLLFRNLLCSGGTLELHARVLRMLLGESIICALPSFTRIIIMFQCFSQTL